MVMTRNYLAGELSQLLAELGKVAGDDPDLAREVLRLRRQAETVPLHALGPVAVRAAAVGDALCWRSLSRGDAVAFGRQAAVGGSLNEFGVCAGLLDEE